VADDRGMLVPLEGGPDHGSGALHRVADALLRASHGDESQPEITVVYNILTDPPGQAGYATLRLDEQMWSLAPSMADTFELLVHLAANAQRWEPTDVFRSVRHRPDGIVMTCRALTVDSTTDAGRAVLANLAEGYYRHGDVAAIPTARGVYLATAFDRADGVARLVRHGAGDQVMELRDGFDVPGGTRIKAAGVLETGLVELVAAMHTRWQRLAT
jgi:hypothetical protein